MSDKHLDQTMSEAYKFISAGTSHDFTFNFPPDKVVFNNLSAWTATANKLPISVWFRDQTTIAHAYQQQVIDSAAAQSFNFLDSATNGFTDVSTAGGQASSNLLIQSITAADPCVVTTTTAHGWQTNQLVRFTNLGNCGVVDHGMAALNNNRYAIVVINSTSFSLKDVISGEPVDATGFDAYVSGGRVCLETHTLTLNNPQVYPYAVTPYVPNPFDYKPVENILRAGTQVMGADGDVFLIEVYKFGQVYDLGDLLT